MIKKNRIALRTSGYCLSYILTHPHKLILYYWRELKYATQRGLYGFADCDLWDLDGYLSDWMPEAIRSYKHDLGFPGSKPYDTFKKWKVVLEKMALGFEARNKLINDCYWRLKVGSPAWLAKMKKLQKQEKEGLELFAKNIGQLWN